MRRARYCCHGRATVIAKIDGNSLSTIGANLKENCAASAVGCAVQNIAAVPLSILSNSLDFSNEVFVLVT